MNNLKPLVCDELTVNILDVLPPMQVIQFKTGKECIAGWAVGKNISCNISYNKSKGYELCYYTNNYSQHRDFDK